MVTEKSSEAPIIVFAAGKNGKRIPMKVSVGPIYDKNGKVIGGIETFRDMGDEYKDIKQAQQIQRDILAKIPSGNDKIRFTAKSFPNDVIGGDFYSIIESDAEHFWFIIADVMGHGVSAALFTMYLDLLWQDLTRDAEKADDIGEITGRMNRRLSELFGESCYFATAICGFIDLTDYTITAAGAGSPDPLLFRAGGQCEALAFHGLPLGVMPDTKYATIEIKINPGDRLLMFSDGATEIFNSSKTLLDIAGLQKILEAQGYPQKDINFSSLTTEMLKYSDRIRFDDDVTFVEFKFN